MRELMDRLKITLQRYPRLYDMLRNSPAAWLTPNSLERRRRDRSRTRRVQSIEREVQQLEAQHLQKDQAAVLFFNTTSVPGGVSFLSLAGLLISWSLRVAGQRVIHLVCHHGMPKCVQGTNLRNLDQPMPCAKCFRARSVLFPRYLSWYIEEDPAARDELRGFEQASTDDLIGFAYQGVELGQLCLPSVRWTLRRHHLTSVPEAQQVLKEYLQAGIRIVKTFERLAEECDLRSVVAFNGTSFPEAIVRSLALKRGLPVVTYEVGYRPHSLFLSHDLATDFPIDLPDGFTMNANQETELDRCLGERMQGDFTMGGVSFWPEMKSVDPELQRKAEAYRKVVTVFTNVVYDTSQKSANTIFESMFDWLDETMKLPAAHPDTLFIVRAHPDELRSSRESQEPVEQWLKDRGHLRLPNVAFISPKEYLSSYDLVHLSRFCIVYNSTIGLEATLLGTPVVIGALAKYSRETITHAPTSRDAYRELVISFLEGGAPSMPESWQQRARRFMYYMLFRASLDLSAFVEPPGNYVRSLSALALHPENSQEMKIIYDGIMNGTPFCYS
jgi:hypothetical protein